MGDELVERRFLLMKRGLYYGPDNRGYTGVKERAGRYLESDARPDSGVTAVHEDEAADYSPSCFPDIALAHALSRIESLTAQLAEARAEGFKEGVEAAAKVADAEAAKGGARIAPAGVITARAIASAIRNLTEGSAG